VLTLLKKVCDHPRLLNPEIPFSRLLTAPPAPRGLNPASDDDDDDDEEDYHRRRGFAVDLNATITYMPDDADADADGEGYEKTLAFTDCVLREAITNGVRHEGTPEEASHDAEYVRVLTRLMSIRADGTGVDTGAIGLDLLHRADMARGVASDSLALADPGRRGTLLPARFSPSAKASSAMIVNASAVDLAMESTKIRVLTELLCALKADGHRTLVFSRSTKMLDLLQPLLMALGMRFERIDGGVRSAQERQARVDRFNSAPSIDVCLLTTTAGGVGLNLTGADRSIIVDPAWNPAVDAQAVDRCYRLGQRRNVVAYRLVTCGTVEEVTYRKQLYKAALNNAATKNQRGAASGAPKFTQRELREVFQFRDSLRSQTLELVRERLLHATPRDTDDELEAHVAFLERGNEGFSIHGVSDHDRVFTVTVEETDEVVDNEEERNPRSTKKGGKDSVEGGQGKGKGKRGGGNDGSGANDAAERRGTVVAVDAETEEALDMAGDAVRMVGATVKRAGGEHAGVQQQKALRSAADLVKKASDRATTDATRGALEAISEFFRISGSLGDSRK
jgi:superfamily II DNA/RNA helicase